MTPVHLHERPAVIYSIALLLLGGQFMSMGFLAELFVAYHDRQLSSYSIAERTSPPKEDVSTNTASSVVVMGTGSVATPVCGGEKGLRRRCLSPFRRGRGVTSAEKGAGTVAATFLPLQCQRGATERVGWVKQTVILVGLRSLIKRRGRDKA